MTISRFVAHGFVSGGGHQTTGRRTADEDPEE